MKRLALVIFVVLILFAGAQLVRPARSNPPARAPLAIDDPAVEAILRRSCADCHSSNTRWPWYAYVAPSSWLVANDVAEGREHLDLSNWRDPKQELRREMCEETREGAMPPWYYLPLHSEARLSEGDVRILCAWAARTGGPAPRAAAGAGDEDDGDD